MKATMMQFCLVSTLFYSVFSVGRHDVNVATDIAPDGSSRMMRAEALPATVLESQQLEPTEAQQRHDNFVKYQEAWEQQHPQPVDDSNDPQEEELKEQVPEESTDVQQIVPSGTGPKSTFVVASAAAGTTPAPVEEAVQHNEPVAASSLPISTKAPEQTQESLALQDDLLGLSPSDAQEFAKATEQHDSAVLRLKTLQQANETEETSAARMILDDVVASTGTRIETFRQKGHAKQEEARTFLTAGKYTLVKRAYWGDDARYACPSGLQMAMPRSAQEMLSLSAVVKGCAGCKVWIGAKWYVDDWYWNDNTPICDYVNWAPGEGRHKNAVTNPFMAMDMFTGAWTDEPDNKMYVACEQKKSYSMVTVKKDAISARTACGNGLQMASPKSSEEQSSITQYLKGKGKNATVWLGGRFHKGRWNWNDGSEVCGYKNWQSGHGGLSYTAEENRWMCLVTTSGMWEECNKDSDNFEVVCEPKPPHSLCVDGSLSGDDLKLSVSPGLRSIEYHGYCFYLAKSGENCNQACAASMGGTCDREATRYAGHNVATCRVVVDHFGKLDYKSSGSYTDDNSGCTYADQEHPWVQVLKKPKSQATCEDTSSDNTRHRVCGCVDDSKWAYPAGHLLVAGETVRVKVNGYSNRRRWWSSASYVDFRPAPGDETILYRLTLDPKKRVANRNSWLGRKWGSAETSGGFEFPGSSSFFTLDFQYGPTHWHTFVDGKWIAEYDFEHRSSLAAVRPRASYFTKAQVLLVQEDPEKPMGYNSANGCLKQARALDTSMQLTFEWKMRATDISGYRVIRANEGSKAHGMTVAMKDGVVQFELRGAEPEITRFTSTTFENNQEYNVAITFDHVKKIVKLYVDKALTETKPLVAPIRAKVTDGQIGCWDGSEQFMGTIRDLTIALGEPNWAPGSSGGVGLMGSLGAEGGKGSLGKRGMIGMEGPKGVVGFSGPAGPKGDRGPASTATLPQGLISGPASSNMLTGMAASGIVLMVGFGSIGYRSFVMDKTPKVKKVDDFDANMDEYGDAGDEVYDEPADQK